MGLELVVGTLISDILFFPSHSSSRAVNVSRLSISCHLPKENLVSSQSNAFRHILNRPEQVFGGSFGPYSYLVRTKLQIPQFFELFQPFDCLNSVLNEI